MIQGKEMGVGRNRFRPSVTGASQVQEQVPLQNPNDPLKGNVILEEFMASMSLLAQEVMHKIIEERWLRLTL